MPILFHTAVAALKPNPKYTLIVPVLFLSASLNFYSSLISLRSVCASPISSIHFPFWISRYIANMGSYVERSCFESSRALKGRIIGSLGGFVVVVGWWWSRRS